MTDSSASQSRPVDGAALEVRLDAAEKLLGDERDRSQALNTRGTATAAAGFALVALLRDPLAAAIAAKPQTAWVESLLDIAAGSVVLAVALAVVVVVLGVLRPQVFQLMDDGELEAWLTDPGMADSESAARYTLLAGVVHATKSRRAMNERKATWLDATYRLQALAVAAATVMLVTLVL